MNFHQLGSTDLQVSSIGMSCVTFGRSAPAAPRTTVDTQQSDKARTAVPRNKWKPVGMMISFDNE